ncbi:MAG: AAA family ATPase, partial [Deltaproteobacteria bacterium]|nr:AAA family ATPase [Deltaproteobacteria bacterium]
NTKADGQGRDGAGRILATYDYTDGAGALLSQVVRFAPKDFRQRRPDERGGWIWSLEGVPRVLYRLPGLVEQGRVFWTEGEKDSDRLAGLGITATTSPGGAQAFRDEYAEQLARLGAQEVVILPDNDAPGRQYATAVARACRRHALQARVLALPGLPPKGDVSDWLDAGHTREELEALANVAPFFDDTPGTEGDPVVRPDESAQAEPADETRQPAASAGPALEPAGLVVAGDDVVLTWGGYDVTITAARPRIRESGGAVRAELNVTRAGRHLHLADFPLASTASRRTEVKALDDIDPTVPWRDLLAHACRVLVDYSRTGDGPAVELKPQMRGGERYLVKPLLVAGHATVLFGDGGAGKGWAALLASLVVASGTPVAGLVPTRQGKVLYLDWEADQEDQQERLALLGRDLGVDPSGIFYRRMSRALPDVAAEIRADLHSIGDVQLIVIDSLMPAGGSGGDRSWHDVSNTVFTTLRTFGPTAQLILAHLSRSDADRPGQGAKPFGSVFNTNFPRAVWEWRRADGAPDELLVGCYHIKTNNTAKHPPFGLRLTFEPNPEHPERVTVAPHDLSKEPDLLARAGLRDQLREALRARALSVADLAKALGKSEDTVRRTLNRMANRGAVKLPDGTWGLPA